MSSFTLRFLIRITACLPGDCLPGDLTLWLSGIAAARRVNLSRMRANIFIEKRTRFVKRSEQLEFTFLKQKTSSSRKS